MSNIDFAVSTARALDDYAGRLANATDALPATEAFLDAYRSVGVSHLFSHADMVEVPSFGPMHTAWHDMHDALRGAIAGIGPTPSIATQSISGAAGLTQRLVAAEQQMTRLERYPHDADFAAIAFSLRKVVNAIAGPTRLHIENDVRQLREFAAR